MGLLYCKLFALLELQASKKFHIYVHVDRHRTQMTLSQLIIYGKKVLLPTLFQIAIAYFCLLLVCIDSLLLFELPKLSPMSIYIHINAKFLACLQCKKFMIRQANFVTYCVQFQQRTGMHESRTCVHNRLYYTVRQGVCFKIIHSINHFMQPINHLMNLTNFYFDVFDKALHLINLL